MTYSARSSLFFGIVRSGWGARAMSTASLAAALLGSAVLLASAQQQQAPAVTVAKPIVREIVEDDEFVGRFEAVDDVDDPLAGRRLSGLRCTSGRRDRQEGRSAVHHRPAALPGGLRCGEVAGRRCRRACSNSPGRSSSAPSSLPRRATFLSRRWTTGGANILAAQAQHQGAQAALRTCQPRPRIHRDQGAARRPHRPPAGLGRQSRAARPTLLTTIVAIDPIDFYFDIDERSYFAYARDARTRGGTMQEGGGGLDVVGAPRRPQREGIQGQARFRRKPAGPGDRHDARARPFRQQGWRAAARYVRPRQRARLAAASGHSRARRGDRRRPGPPHRLCRRRGRHGLGQAGAHRPAHRWLSRHPRGPDRRRDHRHQRSDARAAGRHGQAGDDHACRRTPSAQGQTQ